MSYYSQAEKLGILSSMSSAYAFLPLHGRSGTMTTEQHTAFLGRLDEYAASVKERDGIDEGKKKQIDVMLALLKDERQAQIEYVASRVSGSARRRTDEYSIANRIFQIPGFFTLEPELLQPTPGHKYQTLMLGVLHPLSRGYVCIFFLHIIGAFLTDVLQICPSLVCFPFHATCPRPWHPYKRSRSRYTRQRSILRPQIY